MFAVINLFAAFVLCLLTHEGGHYIAALLCGRRIKFRFAWGRIRGVKIIPRWVWRMPTDLSEQKQRVIALAGFATEFVIAIVAAVICDWHWGFLLAAAHLALYSCYAGDANDLTYL